MRTGFTAFVGMLALAAGCQLIGGLDGITFVADGGAGGTAGAGGMGGAGGGGGAACVLAVAPERPERGLGTGGDLDFVLALHTIDLGEAPEPGDAPVGLDLDGTCTCPEENPCRPIVDPPPDQDDPLCDAPNGRDNNVAKILSLFTLAFRSDQLSERAQRGSWSMLFRVRNYNGEPNDDGIEFSLFGTKRFDEDPCLGGAGGAGGGGGAGGDPDPLWDGTDRWPVLDSSLVNVTGDNDICVGADLDRARFVDGNAYVNDFNLVASLGAVAFVIPSDPTRIHFRLSSAFISGRLERDNVTGLWQLIGAQVVGRLSVQNMLLSIGEITLGADPICTDNPLFGTLKQQICTTADVYAGAPEPTTPCTGTSFGMRISATQADVGGVVVDEPAPTLCPPDTNPALESCD